MKLSLDFDFFHTAATAKQSRVQRPSISELMFLTFAAHYKTVIPTGASQFSLPIQLPVGWLACVVEGPLLGCVSIKRAHVTRSTRTMNLSFPHPIGLRNYVFSLCFCLWALTITGCGGGGTSTPPATPASDGLVWKAHSWKITNGGRMAHSNSEFDTLNHCMLGQYLTHSNSHRYTESAPSSGCEGGSWVSLFSFSSSK